jgi:hypothetical protein
MSTNMTRSNRVSRRHFLGGAGAVGLGTLVPVLESQAQVAAPIKRLILLCSPNGTVHDQWKPTADATTGALTTLSKALAPLEPFKQDILALDNLGWQVGDGPGVDHMRICMLWNGTAMLTGNTFNNAAGTMPCGWGGGVSVDQFVAGRIADKTRFKSLEFGVYQPRHHLYTRVNYAAANQPIPTVDDPYAMFDRLFKTPITGGPTQTPADLERIRLKRQSVIDVVRSNLSAIQAKVSVADRLKIDAHLQAVRQIEQRLDLSATMPVQVCQSPMMATTKIAHQANDNFPAVSRLQIDLMVAALACDVTRVASLLWAHAGSEVRFTWVGASGAHHDISHDSSATARGQMVTINAWHSGEVAYLLGKLKAIPEGGGTMLDNTLVVWGNELADGASHLQHPNPIVFAGGKNLGLKTGRYLTYPAKSRHNRALVSICQLMGLADVTKFGGLDDGAGPLDRLT